MSLYRQAGGRSPRLLAAVLLVGALLGAVAGYVVGRGSVEKPSTAEVIADARAELRPVAAGLELVPIEYEGALSGGEVESPTEYEAAKGAVSRTDAALAAAGEDLRAIDQAGYAAAEEAIARLGEAIDSVAPPARVEALAALAGERIDTLAGNREG